jgi:hypothetical protein
LLCRRGRFGLGGFLLLGGSQNGVKNRAFHARHELDDPGVANVLDEPVDDGVAQLAMRHLAAAEAQTRLHLVAVVQKTDGLVLLGLVVVLVHSDRELDFLDGDDLLLLAGGSLALFLLVEVAAVVLDAANGGDGVGTDFNQVKTAFAGDLQCLKGRQDPKLFAVLVDDADLARANAIVNANKRLGSSFVESDGTPPERVRAGLTGIPVSPPAGERIPSIASVRLRLRPAAAGGSSRFGTTRRSGCGRRRTEDSHCGPSASR